MDRQPMTSAWKEKSGVLEANAKIGYRNVQAAESCLKKSKV